MKLSFLFAAVGMTAPLLAAPVTKAIHDAPEKASDKADKMICKSFLETGSLIATHRLCYTKRQWENARGNIFAKDAAGTCSGGGGDVGGFCRE